MDDGPHDIPLLQAEGVGHRYGRGTVALQTLDLTINHPGVVGLVGPNGAGKSTLLKIWAGLERPTVGRARVAGRDPWTDRPAAARSVAYVAQAPALYRALSVEDHLDFARSERPSFDAAVARSYLVALRIDPRAKVGRLSGGQRAQVGLAIALGTRAKALLLDEPLASLDPLARREFLQILGDAVRESGGTAVLSSHVIGDIEDGCTHLIVLGAGRLLVNGRIAELRDSHVTVARDEAAPPRSETVAAFVDRSGAARLLMRCHDGSAGLPPASLEEIVLGYLTAGRDHDR